MEAPPEKSAYVALLNPKHGRQHDALAVVNVDPSSSKYGQVTGKVEMPNAADELHHFGWNACSSCLSPYAPHAHMERRYLVVPGLWSSRIYIITNSLYGVIGGQFYPDGVKSWMVKVNAKPEGRMELDPNFFLEFKDLRSNQIRLDGGGDSSSDSYCYPP